MADIFYTDAPTIDESTSYPWPSTAPTQRRLRPWQKFLMVVIPPQIAGAFLLRYLTTGDAAVVLGCAVWLLLDAMLLFVAWRADRL